MSGLFVIPCFHNNFWESKYFDLQAHACEGDIMDIIASISELLIGFGLGSAVTACVNHWLNRRKSLEFRYLDAFDRFASLVEERLSVHTSGSDVRKMCGEMKSHFPALIDDLDRLSDAYVSRRDQTVQDILNQILRRKEVVISDAIKQKSHK